ncbi:enoyl-CoA hydratase-related protein [Paraburkholderia flava]|uniref:enoyl-CoA hydratase-related protein n=1 Tax=Paraburkholderia flava TaxID=2547393 RepID=UPI001F1120F5|nr:enoyl-CoA hydratase-related protein [Paraburkholderia flava]
MSDTNLITNASFDAVLMQVTDGILIVTINHAPVNALSVPVRQDLMAAMERANSDSDVMGVVIVGSGRAFCGNTDIAEVEEALRARTADSSRHARLLKPCGQRSSFRSNSGLPKRRNYSKRAFGVRSALVLSRRVGAQRSVPAVFICRVGLAGRHVAGPWLQRARTLHAREHVERSLTRTQRARHGGTGRKRSCRCFMNIFVRIGRPVR